MSHSLCTALKLYRGSNDYNPFKRIESMPGSKGQKGDITDAVRPTI